MKSFREFLEQQEPKPRSAKKEDIIRTWQNLKPGPILMRPVTTIHKGSRYHQDGIRLTGSTEFINSVLGRLKDLLAYETSPGTKLDVEYRETGIKKNNIEEGMSFVCYIYASQR